VHDYVIVGAGSAGCVLAARLTEDPSVRVLLLEAGPPDRKLEIRIPAAFSRLYDSEVDWGFRTAPQEGLGGREVFFPRGRVVGGSSSINAMMVLRGHPSDQGAWGPGWGWGDVEPAYARSEAAFPRAELRDRHPLTEAFVDAAVATGIPPCADLNAPPGEGAGFVPVSQRRGRRFSVADGYLRPALRRPNLELATGAHAERLVLEGRRVVGVSYRHDRENREARAAREVIVGAGAVGSPHLLLLSGIGPASELAAAGVELRHELPGVGRGLRDHLANGILVASEGAETLYSAETMLNLLRWLVRRRGPLTSNVAEGVAFVRSEQTLAAPDLELIFAPVLFEEEGLARPSQHGFTVAAVLLQPESRGEIRLASPDPAAPPVIDPRYLTDPSGRDIAVLLRGIRLSRQIAATEPLARFASHELLPGPAAVGDADLVQHLRDRSQTLYHPVGTCRLGTDELAVVDPALRVRGLEGVRVVDASVIPALPRGHTNWPTVMVAERAADLIREDAGTSR
jgi:choline dehydrogenase